MTVKTPKIIDTERFSLDLRRRGINLESKKVLMTRFPDSVQARDLALPPNCGGFGRIHHFRRTQGEGWPPNPLPIDPALHSLGLPAQDTVHVQVFQNAICSWRCWYCFVDFDLLSANPKHADFKTADELLELYLDEKPRPRIIDLSGGQPDLVPELTLWFADAVQKRGLAREIYLWSDDNLSCDYLWKHLTREEIRRLGSYKNYARVGCFKGFDTNSFSFNTKADPTLFSTQFKLMRRLVETGFDVYGYATFTSNSDKQIHTQMADFVDRLQSEVHELFPLRTVPLRIREYSPNILRMGPEHHRALKTQEIAVSAWMDELETRFTPEQLRQPIYQYQLGSVGHSDDVEPSLTHR